MKVLLLRKEGAKDVQKYLKIAIHVSSLSLNQKELHFSKHRFLRHLKMIKVLWGILGAAVVKMDLLQMFFSNLVSNSGGENKVIYYIF